MRLWFIAAVRVLARVAAKLAAFAAAVSVGTAALMLLFSAEPKLFPLFYLLVMVGWLLFCAAVGVRLLADAVRDEHDMLLLRERRRRAGEVAPR